MIKPILFNTEMVRAILDGRKTVTRRLVKPQPLYKTHRKFIFDDDVCPKKWEDCDDIIGTYQYQVGDILYVRETWHEYMKRVGEGESCRLQKFYGYRASVANSEDADEPWRPSIHMPKEAARIWLKVTDVRVERLQDMNGKDVLKEGLNSHVHPDAFYFDMNQREMFERLWNSTIKKQDLSQYGWKANPWVWVIEFERCEKPEE